MAMPFIISALTSSDDASKLVVVGVPVRAVVNTEDLSAVINPFIFSTSNGDR